MEFESLTNVHLQECECGVVWSASQGVTQLPIHFADLFATFPQVRRFRYVPTGNDFFNQLLFIVGTTTRHNQSYIDIMQSSATLRQLQDWLLVHLSEFHDLCLRDAIRNPMHFEPDSTLGRCECAVTWASSWDITTNVPPANFAELFSKYPDVRKFRYVSMQYDDDPGQTLIFTIGGGFHNLSLGSYNPDTKKSYDINPSTPFEELEEWLLSNLRHFYSGCLLSTTTEIKKSFQSQIRNGDNPYCIVWRAKSSAKMPYILIYTFLKIPGVHIAFLKSSKVHHLEMWSPSAVMPTTISNDADFQDQRNWIKTQLSKLANQRVATIVDRLPDFRTDIMPKMDRNEIAYCLVWYGPKNDPIPDGLVELKHKFPNVCVAHTIDDSHEIWMVNQSQSLRTRLPDSATLSDLRQFIESTSKFRRQSR